MPYWTRYDYSILLHSDFQVVSLSTDTPLAMDQCWRPFPTRETGVPTGTAHTHTPKMDVFAPVKNAYHEACLPSIGGSTYTLGSTSTGPHLEDKESTPDSGETTKVSEDPYSDTVSATDQSKRLQSALRVAAEAIQTARQLNDKCATNHTKNTDVDTVKKHPCHSETEQNMIGGWAQVFEMMRDDLDGVRNELPSWMFRSRTVFELWPNRMEFVVKELGNILLTVLEEDACLYNIRKWWIALATGTILIYHLASTTNLPATALEVMDAEWRSMVRERREKQERAVESAPDKSV